MISLSEKENKDKIKVYDDLNTKLWGMADIFPYYFEAVVRGG